MIKADFHHKQHYKIQAYSKKILYITLFLTLSFALIEYIGGILSNSLALLGDSFHMFSDVIALGFSFINKWMLLLQHGVIHKEHM